MSNEEKRTPMGGKNIALILIMVLLLGLAAAGFLLWPWGTEEPTPQQPSQPTETTVQEEDQYLLYWNVDREKYQDPETGLSSRKPNEKDGYFHVLFAYKGRQGNRRVIDKKLVNRIDKLNLMGLVTNEEGVVVDVLELEEFTGGTLAARFYVQSVEGQTVVADSSKTLKGMEEVLTIHPDVKVYDVSPDDDSAGMESVIRKGDRIIGVLNKAGELTHVYIIERAFSGTTELRHCQHCDLEVEWYGWNNPEELPLESGHYFLTENVTLTKQHSIPADQTIVLDLAGYTVTAGENKRVYSLHNEGVYLGIMDTSPAQTGKLQTWGTLAHAQGGVVWVRYGLFELFGGTLDASCQTNDLYGLAVMVNKEMTFNMYGGTIIGGKSISYTNPNTLKKSGAYAGSVWIEGTMNMYGGVIRDGRAVADYDPATGKYTRGNAGNVYVGASGTLNMTGGKILNGKADGDGGNLYVSGTVKISGDVEISGGSALKKGKRGGNVLVSASGSFTMDGGRISGGTSNGSSGNIYAGGKVRLFGVTITRGKSTDSEIENMYINGDTILAGSYITGDVYVTKDSTLTLRGATKIVGGKNYNLKLAQDALINPTYLDGNASIGLTASGFFTGTTAESAAQYFFLDCDDGEVLYTDSRLFAGKQYCLCGSVHDSTNTYCDGTLLLWNAWTDDSELPTDEGNYYLTGDVRLSKRTTLGKIGGTAADARDVKLDLNGYTVTGGENSRVIFVVSHNTFSLLDTSSAQTGKLAATGVCVENGHTIYGGSNTVINIYGGSVEGGTAQAVITTSTAADGTATYKASYGQGGNIYTYGVLNIYGGTVTGGTAKAVYLETTGKHANGQGGNIYVYSQGKLNLYGGTITGGVADQNGGNIYSAGDVQMHEAAQILGGSTALDAKTGGNIYISGTGDFDMHGGLVSGGTATSNGGNVMTFGRFNLLGGTVESGTSGKFGGNICVGGSGAATVSGGVVQNGSAQNGTDEAGNAIINGMAPSSNMIVLANGSLTVSGGQIQGCVRVLNDAVLMLDGKANISGGESGLSLDSAVLASVGTLEDGAGIVIDTDAPDRYFAVTYEAGNAAYFTAADGQTPVTYDDVAGKLRLGEGSGEVSGHTHCLCVGNQEHACIPTVWLPWNADASPDYLTTLPKSGNYYLTANVDLSGKISPSGTLSICLNGFAITAPGGDRAFLQSSADAVLNITDCTEDFSKAGVIQGDNNSQNGGVLFIQKGVLNLYNGILRQNLTVAGQHGVVVRVGNGNSAIATFNMYGGMITGGMGTDFGGGIRVSQKSTFNMYGGLINGNTATNGGGVYVHQHTDGNKGILNLYGGSITGNTATMGGGVYNIGEMSVFGEAEITGNSGSNLYLPSGITIIAEGTLTGNRKIGVTLEGGIGIFAVSEVESNREFFFADDDVGIITHEGTTLAITVETGGGEEPEPEQPEVHIHCVCAGNQNHNCSQIEWLPWNADADPNYLTTLPKSGNYYLTADVNLDAKISPSGALSICLNGFTITAPDGDRAFLLSSDSAVLNITDCIIDKTQTGAVQGNNNSQNGGLVFVQKGKLNVYNGTLRQNLTVSGQHGVVVRVGNGNTATGTFTMYGGAITGGMGGEYGGGVRISQKSTFAMYGGTITGNFATNGGGVYVHQHTDGNMGTFTMYGGSVTGNTATNGGGVYDNGLVTVSGEVQITGNTGGNLYLVSGRTFAIEATLTGSVGVTMADATGTFAVLNETDPDAAKMKELAARFIPDGTGLLVDYVGAELKLLAHEHCICGSTNGNHKTGCVRPSRWSVWDGSSEELLKGGSYVLTRDVALAEMIDLKKTSESGADVVINLCLNGHTLTGASNERLFQVYDGYTLNICDCGTTGKITGSGQKSGVGGIMQLNAGSTVNQFGGIITGGNATGNGGNIIMYGSDTGMKSHYNLWNGKIINGRSGNIGGNLNVGKNAVFSMYGGEISGGTAKTANANSNNIGMTGAGEMNLSAGYIAGCIRATNGTINLSGSIRVQNGTPCNLSVNKNSIIKVTGTLSGENMVGITRGSAASFVTDVTEDVSAFFFSDNTDYVVWWDEANSQLALKEES